MACGCPMVLANNPSLVEMAGDDTVVVVNPNDVDDVANAMFELLTDEDLRNNG